MIGSPPEQHDEADAKAIYDLLEEKIVPLFFERAANDVPVGWVRVMKEAVASLEFSHLCRCMDGNQGMFPHLFDIRPQRTKGAVIRRIEFVQPGNLAAEDTTALHQMDGVAATAHVESCANPGDAAANNQNRRCNRAIHLLIFLFSNDPIGFSELLDPFHKPVLEILFAVFLA